MMELVFLANFRINTRGRPSTTYVGVETQAKPKNYGSANFHMEGWNVEEQLPVTNS